jgi:hypothetical protein
VEHSYHRHSKQGKKEIDILRGLIYKLDRRSLEKLYLCYIRPTLEFSSITYDNCSKEESDLLEQIQLSAARTVTGATRVTSHSLLYQETGWESLKTRRKPPKIKDDVQDSKQYRSRNSNRTTTTENKRQNTPRYSFQT